MLEKKSRRLAIKNILVGTAALGVLPNLALATEKNSKRKTTTLKGNINHSVCRWCYSGIPLEEFCQSVKKLNFSAIDLVGPKDWDMLKKYGIFSSMCNGAEISIPHGWNDKQYHATLIKNYTDMIPLVAKAGYKNLICFSGNRSGIADDEGLKTCVEGLKQIMPLAEKNNVIIQMELLNSKVNHKDYMCDKSPWGIELVKAVSSDNFRLLYDIYHMQIDEGDVIRTIQNNHQYFGHYHTGGVPGRHEIDDTQELYYPAIMKAIVETGYKGYVAQEFIPKRDPLTSLKEAISICDV